MKVQRFSKKNFGKILKNLENLIFLAKVKTNKSRLVLGFAIEMQKRIRFRDKTS